MGNRRIIAAVARAVLILAILIALIGYPAVIWLSVLVAWAMLAFFVVLSAGDMFEKPARPAGPQEQIPTSAKA
jgi:purine-cytosine permease-like protein